MPRHGGYVRAGTKDQAPVPPQGRPTLLPAKKSPKQLDMHVVEPTLAKCNVESGSCGPREFPFS